MQDPPEERDPREVRKQRFRRLERFRIPILPRSSGLAAGVHRSSFKGHGVEFTELREYVPGDDIRAIDWKVTARLGQPFIRLFSEERDVTICFVVDVSGSTEFGSRMSKADLARDIAGALILSALRHHDAVGLLLFSDQVEKYIPPRKGRHHVLGILNTLFDFCPGSRRTDIIPALHHLAGALKRQASVVIISDFSSPPFLWELAVLKRRHQVFAIRIADPREGEIPDIGFITLEDSESGEQIVIDTSGEKFRDRYRELSRGSSLAIRRDLAERQVPLATVMTDGKWERDLARFFRG
ncbi:MAG: DUF58 domain-containing protein [Methanolinea sp.]|nr:DUF58 domain-containing protein [Methanolinea sp.]